MERWHPDYDTLRHLFTEVVRHAALGLKDRRDVVTVPDDLLEIKTMLTTQVQEWTQQWQAAGKAEGKAEMLLRQLRRRLKTLPQGVEDRLHVADGEQLDT